MIVCCYYCCFNILFILLDIFEYICPLLNFFGSILFYLTKVSFINTSISYQSQVDKIGSYNWWSNQCILLTPSQTIILFFQIIIKKFVEPAMMSYFYGVSK